MSIQPEPSKINGENAHTLSEFRLIPTIIRRPDRSDEIFFLPLCSACGQPITDFADANICVLDPYRDSDEYPEKFETVAELPNGAKLLRIPGETLALHKSCDEDRLKPWKPMNTILQSDQRYSWEKPAPPTPAKRKLIHRVPLNKLGRAA